MSKTTHTASRPRIPVAVNGTKFVSTQAAFRHFRLPMGSLARVRAALHADGRATFKTARKEYGFKVLKH